MKLEDLKNQEKKAIQQVYLDNRQKLTESEEANMVIQLRSLLGKAEDKLKQRSSQLLEQAKAETFAVSNNFALDRRNIDLNCTQEQQEVLDDRQVFAEFSSVPDSAKDNDALSLCISNRKRCGNTFRANNLPKHKRCSAAGCTSVFLNLWMRDKGLSHVP